MRAEVPDRIQDPADLGLARRETQPGADLRLVLPIPSISRRARGAVAGLALLTAACATHPAEPSPPPAAPAAPATPAGTATGDTGLGLAGAETPQALKTIALSPYLVSDPPDCAAMARAIGDLDRLLGPDLDVPALDDRRDTAGRLAMGVLRGAIPYRWVVRWMTQAGRRDRELQRAILAGVARRGYLKGLRRGLACPPPGA